MLLTYRLPARPAFDDKTQYSNYDQQNHEPSSSAETCTLQNRGSELMVKRRGKQLPANLAMGTPGSEQIDWHASVMLNLVMQTSYELSLAACK